MKKIIQIRFFGDNGYPHFQRLDNNFPLNLTIDDLVTGDIFSDYMPIHALKISALPGTKFYLDSSLSPQVIGASGEYKIDKIKKSTSLNFERTSLDQICVNPDGYLVIDIEYEEV